MDTQERIYKQIQTLLDKAYNDAVEDCAKLAENVSRHTGSVTLERDYANKILPRVANSIRTLKRG